MKVFKRTALIMLVLLLFALSGCGRKENKATKDNAEKASQNRADGEIATSGEATYPTHTEGIPGLEIGISGDNKIMLEEENITLNYLPDEKYGLICTANTDYELLNSEPYEAYAAIGVVRILKLSQVTIKHEDEENFDCGSDIYVDGSKKSGYIYPIDTPETIRENSVYDSFYEAMSGIEYSGYFDEGFASYGITSFLSHEIHSGDDVTGIPISEERTLYRVDEENGTEMLCIVIYNLHFDAHETQHVSVTQNLLPDMTRPTKYSKRGTKYEFCYNGTNLKSFYSVRDVNIVVNADKDGEFAFIESDAPHYMKDGVRTIHYVGSFKPFKTVLGEDLTEDEIYDIYTESGTWKKVLRVVDFVTVLALILAVAYVINSIRKRKKSGIGMQL